MVRAAVVLSGCGRADGSEIHESVSLLVHLARQGAQVRCFAPDVAQPAVVNHATGTPVPGESRNAMVESARISRGEITVLSRLEPERFDALVFPGGLGAARTLCTFAEHGDRCTVLPDVERVIRAFHGARRPIGLCCIAPVLAARVLGRAGGGPGCRITLGPEGSAAARAREMGADVVPAGVGAVVTDEANLLVSTPAYMCEARPHEVYDGIGVLVARTLELCAAGGGAPH